MPTRHLAELAGFELVPCETAVAQESDLRAHLTGMIRESGEACQGLSQALEDGRIDHREAASILVECKQARGKIAEVEAAIGAGPAPVIRMIGEKRR